MAQPFLEAGQGRLLIPGFDIDHTVRRQPRCFQPRREQILVAHAPQDLPLGAGHDAGGKQSCGRTIERVIAGTGDLMQGAQGQPAAGQTRIHLRQPKRQNPA